jgi:putative DNA primase/helicase
MAGLELDPSKYPQTDSGSAEAFVTAYGDRFRHVRERRQWLALESGRWRRDRTGEPNRAALATVRALLQEAVKIKDSDLRTKAVRYYLGGESAARIRALLERAETVVPIPVTEDDLDTHPFLLSCLNGTIDLRNGALRAHDPRDLITLGNEIVYDPDATCPLWLEFLDDTFAGKADMVAFIRRAYGYCLSGDAREGVVFLPFGRTHTGKTTALETLKLLLGGMGITVGTDTLLRTKNPRTIRNDIARLYRARVVTASETGAGRRLNEEDIKRFSGQDKVNAEFKYQEIFEFKPQFKIWLATNSKPQIACPDDALRSRLRLIPFVVSHADRVDRTRGKRLQKELPGILAWAVEGCLEWQRDGLGSQPDIDDATDEWFREEDVLGAFLVEDFETGTEWFVSKSDLRERYERFCDEFGARPLAAGPLGKQLRERGFEPDRMSGTHVYKGLRFR